ELDPLSMIILTDAARNLYLARRYDEAINQYQRSLDVDPNFPIAHKGLAEVYAQIGKYDEAVSEIERAIALSGRSIFILDDLGYAPKRGKISLAPGQDGTLGNPAGSALERYPVGIRANLSKT